MKKIQNFSDFNESASSDSTKKSLEKIFKVYSFEVDVVYNELNTEIECYVDIVLGDEFTSEEKDKIYSLIEDASKYIKSVNGKLSHIILSNLGTGNEVRKSSIESAKAYKKDITSIRVWFDIQSFGLFKENLNISDVRQRLFESEDSLYRSIKKYYKTFLTNWLDENDPDRDFGSSINQEDFIEDCIDMFGENGTEEYNSGYDNEIVKKVSRQVLDEEE